MKFKTRILSSGKTAAGIIVPPEIVEGLGAGKKPKVVASLNGFTYRSSVSLMGGDFMLPVSNDIRAKSGLAAGDEVEVELTVDTEVREVAVPPDLAEALAKEPAAKQKFESLSYSRKSWYVLPIQDAKTPETRQRRIEKAVAGLLSDG